MLSLLDQGSMQKENYYYFLNELNDFKISVASKTYTTIANNGKRRAVRIKRQQAATLEICQLANWSVNAYSPF